MGGSYFGGIYFGQYGTSAGSAGAAVFLTDQLTDELVLSDAPRLTVSLEDE